MAHPWEMLRPVVSAAEQFNIAVKWVLLLISIALLVLSLGAYQRSKSKRILIVSFAFLLFFLKALFKLVALYFSPGNFFAVPEDDAADFMIMLAIFVAIFYNRSGGKYFAPKD